LVDQRELATVELLGALAYGQLRAFEATARTIPHAPSAREADELATFAIAEHARYERLRDHLAKHTELPTAVMDRQRRAFDAYFDRAPLDEWLGASVFFALGLAMAADFARALAPALDADTAAVVVSSMDRGEVERTAIRRLAAMLADDDEATERARHLAADLLGRALTGFQEVMGDSDALHVLLAARGGAGETAEQRVKRLAISVLEGHRRRVVELGLEDLDDVS
jgi:hypothetical protein